VPPRLRPTLLATTILLVSALAIAVALGGPSNGSSKPSSPPQEGSTSGFDGALVPAGVRPLDFTLSDQHGRRVSLRRYRGQVTILTFLYSTCRDTCPLIAQQIRGALDDIGRTLPTLAVSVDPQADTRANVRGFLARASLTGRMEYLTGTRAQLKPIWRSYGILPESAGDAASDHSAYVLLIDRGGRERVSFPVEGLTPDNLAHDLRKLEAEKH